MKRVAATLALGASMSTMIAAEDWQHQFQKVSDEYFDQVYFHYGPTDGTSVGYHRYDAQLEDFSRRNIEAEVAALNATLAKLEAVKAQRERKAEEDCGPGTGAVAMGTRDPNVAVPVPCSGSDNYVVYVHVTVSPDGKAQISGVERTDRLPSEDTIRTIERQILDKDYKPDIARGMPVGKPTVVSVAMHLFHDPVSADLDMVESSIRAQLLALETIRMWEKDPDVYSNTASNAAFVLMERKFAPPDDRLRSLIAREKQMPGLLDQARDNLKNPPHIYTEIAIEQLPGIVSFFEHDVPLAFADAQDATLKAEFAQTNAAVIAALKSYLDWLRNDLLPRSNGDFRIGAETFSKKLEYDEMVDLPLPKLLDIGWADLRKNQQQFNEVAKELEPDKDPRAVLEELGSMHPAPDRLLASFRATFDGLVSFIRAHHIVTIPSDIRPILEETPPFMRATTFASMDTPGPFETHATEAYFNVTLPDPSMTPKEVDGYMHSFNIGTIISTAVHEAYPGHYIQFLWVPQAPSRVRKLLGANTNVEGWAHYCEQMMLDEGYGQPGAGAKDERESKFLRLGQLQDALLRDARFIVGIGMHTGSMTYDQAVEFFQKEGYQSKETAEVETKRGTSDPTYLYYTLGKLEIMKLREDVKKKEGDKFSLEQFHDDFLRQGFPPIKIVRQAMLGDDSPTL